MRSKNMMYLGLVAVGVACLLCSQYIRGQVGEGREKIERGQKTIDRGNSLFSLNPVTKEVGKGITGSAQSKIDEGSKEADFYEGIAMLLRVGGIVLIAAGGGLFLYHLMKK